MKISICTICFLLLLYNLSLAYPGKNVNIDSLATVLRQTDNDTIRVNICNDIAYQYRNSDLSLADKYARQALDIAERIDYSIGMVQSYNNIGNMHYIKGDFPAALQNYLSSLKIMTNLDNKEGVANCMMGVGNVYYMMKDIPLAIDYQKKALKIRQEIGDSSGIASSFNNIGVILQEEGEFKASLTYHLQALELRKHEKDKRNLSSSYGNIGNIYQQLGEYTKALEYQQKAYEIRKSLNNKKGIVLSYNDIGAIHQSMNNNNKAIEYLEKGLALAKEINFGDGIRKSYLALSNTYELLKQYNKSLEFHKRYTAVKDSIFTTEKSMQIVEMQTLYETEKKEKEIQILTRDKEIQSLRLDNQQNQLQKQKAIIIMTICGLVMLVLLVFLFFNLYRYKRKANSILEARNREITKQKEIIALKNQNITDSLEYAKSIQDAFLPTYDDILALFSNYFIYFNPKDIVSGDFYWVHKTISGKIIWATADCTGHGVPGALMSILGISLLNEIVVGKNIEQPDEILNELRLGIVNSLGQMEHRDKLMDGIDLSICILNPATRKLNFAGANSSIVTLHNKELFQYKGDKQPAGFLTGELKPFSQQEIPIDSGDMIYSFTDGYQDQFGGANDEKFRINKLKELFCAVHELPIQEQQAILARTYAEWLAFIDPATELPYQQMDDVLIIGIRIP